MPRPTLTFFNELPGNRLKEVFPATIDQLKALQAGISMGIVELSDERAAVVRQLNEAGIPVIAWQLLPQSEGYWYNLDNAPQALARYQEFRQWTADHGLKWAGVAIDIEQNIDEQAEIFIKRSLRPLPKLIRRAFDSQRLIDGKVQYNMLIAQMHADGYRVDSYTMSFMLDEKRAGSTLIQKLTGLIDLNVDRDIPMLYTSFMGPSGPALLWSYAQEDLDGICIGTTGGGVEIEGIVTGDVNLLDWDALTRDLLIASQRTKDIHIFSLEGCYRQGMLEKLCDFNWDQPFTLPDTTRINRIRRGVHAALWVSEHPAWVLLGLLLLRGRGARRKRLKQTEPMKSD